MNTVQVKQSVKPNGANEHGYKEEYAQEIVTNVTYEQGDPALVELAVKQMAVAFASKVRAAMGNALPGNKYAFVTADEWAAVVAEWNNRTVTCEYLLTPTSKKDSDAAFVEMAVQKCMARKGCTRAEAIAWVKENW